jgi:hypothetical protein
MFGSADTIKAIQLYDTAAMPSHTNSTRALQIGTITVAASGRYVHPLEQLFLHQTAIYI